MLPWWGAETHCPKQLLGPLVVNRGWAVKGFFMNQVDSLNGLPQRKGRANSKVPSPLRCSDWTSVCSTFSFPVGSGGKGKHRIYVSRLELRRWGSASWGTGVWQCWALQSDAVLMEQINLLTLSLEAESINGSKLPNSSSTEREDMLS